MRIQNQNHLTEAVVSFFMVFLLFGVGVIGFGRLLGSSELGGMGGLFPNELAQREETTTAGPYHLI